MSRLQAECSESFQHIIRHKYSSVNMRKCNISIECQSFPDVKPFRVCRESESAGVIDFVAWRRREKLLKVAISEMAASTATYM